MGATSPANFSQIGDIACAAVCRWSAGSYRQTLLMVTVGGKCRIRSVCDIYTVFYLYSQKFIHVIITHFKIDLESSAMFFYRLLPYPWIRTTLYLYILGNWFITVKDEKIQFIRKLDTNIRSKFEK